MGLSERQENILSFVKSFTLHNGYPPTIREIGKAVNISSTSVVNYNLDALQRLGFIYRDRTVSRGIRLVDGLGELKQIRGSMRGVGDQRGGQHGVERTRQGGHDLAGTLHVLADALAGDELADQVQQRDLFENVRLTLFVHLAPFVGVSTHNRHPAAKKRQQAIAG